MRLQQTFRSFCTERKKIQARGWRDNGKIIIVTYSSMPQRSKQRCFPEIMHRWPKSFWKKKCSLSVLMGEVQVKMTRYCLTQFRQLSIWRTRRQPKLQRWQNLLQHWGFQTLTLALRHDPASLLLGTHPQRSPYTYILCFCSSIHSGHGVRSTQTASRRQTKRCDTNIPYNIIQS